MTSFINFKKEKKELLITFSYYILIFLIYIYIYFFLWAFWAKYFFILGVAHLLAILLLGLSIVFKKRKKRHIKTGYVLLFMESYYLVVSGLRFTDLKISSFIYEDMFFYSNKLQEYLLIVLGIVVYTNFINYLSNFVKKYKGKYKSLYEIGYVLVCYFLLLIIVVLILSKDPFISNIINQAKLLLFEIVYGSLVGLFVYDLFIENVFSASLKFKFNLKKFK